MNAPIPVTPQPADTVSDPTSPDRASRCRAILQRKIDEGVRRATEILAAIHSDQPRDQLVRAQAVHFNVAPSGIDIVVGPDAYQPTDFALGQIAARAGIPAPYLRELAEPTAESWRHELAVDILRRHHEHAGDARVLVRSVRGRLRGWLSDKYRRLDSRPLIEALAAQATEAGAIPVDELVTETRVALKVLVPEILEPIPGEFVAIGGEWSNSDFGNGVHAFRAYAIRIVCLLC